MLQRSLLSAGVAALVLFAGCSSYSQKPEAVEPLPAPPSPPVATSEPASAAADALAANAMSQRRFAAESMAKSARTMAVMPQPAYPAPMPSAESRERYEKLDANPVQRVAEHPVSTFSVDVDTGSYANLRRFLRGGQLPPKDAVRAEELINYLDYGYEAPRDRDTPFGLITEIGPTPWNPKTRLLHVGIQGWVPPGERPAANLVFLVDTSGSMQSADKLPLVIASLKLLTAKLRAQDRVSLVTYSGQTQVVLEPTPGDRRDKIAAALERLQAGGGTNGGAGLELAYSMARQGYIDNGVNRVLVATDGDFNLGVTSFDALLQRVQQQRKSGVALTTLGFGTGNYNEQLMERLADAGDGNYAYIDSLSEAQKVLVREAGATLTTIARDVKIQLEFNPALVAEYRLIGYENRQLRREDFSNDQIDAGDIGAGHRVTALYEIALAGEGGERIEALRYGADSSAAPGKSGELAHLRLRYKRPQDGQRAQSRLIERALTRHDVVTSLASTSPAFRLSAAVAGFGQLLRGSEYLQGFDYTAVETLARNARGADANGEVGEFMQLVQLADSLTPRQSARADLPGE
ncbi:MULTISPECIES: vWA domain-containing protein [Hydrocarboniphaga]|uniref:VWFA domain-containing protein n=1 Tax=Hydrocarboniphaga effusa AP103 TaxID=1172194 RepID=I8T6B4_9GAMM|nr:MULTISPECIES: VWA domain-containing protein [Hydrocarboniphaga]EIT69288.1 hypothetical protein WQQ_28700 [Hydrocarboniphaga effusa AP103]MDZ4080719.1 VWA domain-containing protein [Hydrocarboniphaga sp.]